MTSTGPLLLLDSASMYFRAFFGLPESLTAPDGTSVNAARGFLDAIARLVATHRPSRVIACWDEDWRPAFRVAAIPSYKEHRLADDGGEQAPAGLTVQVPIIADVLAALGIPRLGAPGYEADDVIGTLVARETAAAARAQEVLVMTGDRDLFQLVDDDAGVAVLYPLRGFKEPQRIDETWLTEKYAVASGQAYADMATLRGDPSDGLPGVAGIGEKTAATLLTRYENLAGVVAAAQDPGSGMSPAQRKRILAAEDYLAVAPTVVEVARDAPVAQDSGDLSAVPADPAALAALAERWGLQSPLKRLLDACTAVTG